MKIRNRISIKNVPLEEKTSNLLNKNAKTAIEKISYENNKNFCIAGCSIKQM